MSGTNFGYAEELGHALHRRGYTMSQQDLLAALREVEGFSAEELPADERMFLLQNTDLKEEDLTPEARDTAQLAITRNRIAAEFEVADTALTTRQVAGLLHRAEANVRRSRLNGDLYATHAGGAGTSLRFPRWQFTEDGRVVPGLREIIPAFPRHYHPLSIESFMTTETDELDGFRPVTWLLDGGPAGPLIALVNELNYE